MKTIYLQITAVKLKTLTFLCVTSLTCDGDLALFSTFKCCCIYIALYQNNLLQEFHRNKCAKPISCVISQEVWTYKTKSGAM